jgi:hypothetical protein
VRRLRGALSDRLRLRRPVFVSARALAGWVPFLAE